MLKETQKLLGNNGIRGRGTTQWMISDTNNTSHENLKDPPMPTPPPGKEGLNKTFIGEWWSIIPYTTWKVNDATPMSWFIIAPYQLPPNLGLAYLRHLFALRCHKGGFPAFSAGQVSVESQSVDWTHWPPWARKLSLSFPKRFPKKLKRWKPQKILFLQISMTYDLWVTKKQNKELLMCLCVCMWIAWFFWCLPWSVGQQRFVFCVQNVILLIVCKILVFWRANWCT